MISSRSAHTLFCGDGAERVSKRAPGLADLRLLRRRLCETLAHAGPLEQQLLYRQQLEELEPLIRFCQYEQGKAGASAAHTADETALSEHLQVSSSSGKCGLLDQQTCREQPQPV